MSIPVLLTFEAKASHDQSGIALTVQLDANEPTSVVMSTISHKFSLELDDETETEHELSITMHGKTAQHTILDSDGNFVQDVLIQIPIEHCFLDEINIGQILSQFATYTHDHNGTSDLIEYKFYGVMGCNGTVKLKFRTPAYLWLLEHL
jgi:hypothetical protein